MPWDILFAPTILLFLVPFAIGGGHCKVAGDYQIGAHCDELPPDESVQDSDDEISLDKTGLEFLRDEDKLELDYDEQFFFNASNGNLTSTLEPSELAGIFIQSLKEINVSAGFALNNGSKDDEKYRPDWVFQPYGLKNLAKIEMRIYRLLKQHSQTLEHHIPVLESYLKDIEESTLEVLTIANYSDSVDKNRGSFLHKDPYFYIATHPILIYRMIRRFAMDLETVLVTFIETQNNHTLLKLILEEANPDSVIFPDVDDLLAAWKSLGRIQIFSGINTYDLAKGKFENIDTGFGTNALYALEMGMHYVEFLEYDLAIEWLHLALQAIKKSQIIQVQNHPFIVKFFEKCLETAVELHNNHWKDYSNYEWSPSVFHTNVTLPFRRKQYIRMTDLFKIKAADNRKKDIIWNSNIKLNYLSTCAGKNLQSEGEKAELFCWNDRESHPYWFVNPLKVEMLHKNPPVFQVHEFIGDKMAEKIKAKALKISLKRSYVVADKQRFKQKLEDTRTSTQTWVHEVEDSAQFMAPLTRQMEFMSGLIISQEVASDAYQVALYGPSHHYETHLDAFEDLNADDDKGNRLTTIMGYLSDTDVGGRTVFPVLGISLTPKKGSVVMWHNLMRHMRDRDYRTWHGGCPVALGTKWIANKWIYSSMNLFRHKCTLSQDE